MRRRWGRLLLATVFLLASGAGESSCEEGKREFRVPPSQSAIEVVG